MVIDVDVCRSVCPPGPAHGKKVAGRPENAADLALPCLFRRWLRSDGGQPGEFRLALSHGPGVRRYRLVCHAGGGGGQLGIFGVLGKRRIPGACLAVCGLGRGSFFGRSQDHRPNALSYAGGGGIYCISRRGGGPALDAGYHPHPLLHTADPAKRGIYMGLRTGDAGEKSGAGMGHLGLCGAGPGADLTCPLFGSGLYHRRRPVGGICVSGGGFGGCGAGLGGYHPATHDRGAVRGVFGAFFAPVSQVACQFSALYGLRWSYGTPRGG